MSRLFDDLNENDLVEVFDREQNRKRRGKFLRFTKIGKRYYLVLRNEHKGIIHDVVVCTKSITQFKVKKGMVWRV